MEPKRGGKREGAGRKPSGVEKKTISIYVEKGAIYKFGNEDKLKEKLYDFVSGYGVQDLNKPTNVMQPQEQPQTNFSIDTTSKPLSPRKPMLEWIAEKKALETEDQYEKWLKLLEADDWLTDGQKAVIRKS